RSNGSMKTSPGESRGEDRHLVADRRATRPHLESRAIVRHCFETSQPPGPYINASLTRRRPEFPPLPLSSRAQRGTSGVEGSRLLCDRQRELPRGGVWPG